MKIGDNVPRDDYEIFIVEKLYVEEESQSDYDDYSNYKLGQRIIVEKSNLSRDIGGYTESFKDFLENNCRVANGEEKNEIYEEEFSNALVQDVYEDDSYRIAFYYVPIKDVGVEEYVNAKDYWEKSKIKDNVFERMGIDYASMYEIDDEGKFIYVEDHKAREELLDYCRLATKEEAQAFNKIIAERKRIKREAYIARKQAEEKERTDRYNKNKSDANYYPGSCGNYNQVLVNKDGKPEKVKLYDLYTIKQFYNELINSGKIDKNILESIMLYGGTVPYILSDTIEKTRKFGDIDIFIPVENMQVFRNQILDKPYFKMQFDSMDLTKKAELIVGRGFERPLYYGESRDMEAYREYERMVAKLEEEAKKKRVYQDYGFKGSLFGINISVFPIYAWDKDNKLDICAKSFRVGEDEGDSKFLLNTVVTHNTPITSFSKLVEICGGHIGVVNLEYTVASKKSAINHGYKLRKESDLADLEFIEENKSILNINDDLVKHYEENVPDYGIAKVYRIKRNYEICEYSPEEYKNAVTKNIKPS